VQVVPTSGVNEKRLGEYRVVLRVGERELPIFMPERFEHIKNAVNAPRRQSRSIAGSTNEANAVTFTGEARSSNAQPWAHACRSGSRKLDRPCSTWRRSLKDLPTAGQEDIRLHRSSKTESAWGIASRNALGKQIEHSIR
jgi:hypothetical protein